MIPRPFFQQEQRNLRIIGWWLLAVAGLVFLMILVGGATRLTESGLSIVEWKLASGILPPMSEQAWQAEFEAYRQFPEYRLKNAGMTLEEFKAIYWWEYTHRLLGRLIGLAYALPLLLFIARRMVPQALKFCLFVLLAIGAGQGLLGWYMVESGLIHQPAVSHLRLLAHLSVAVLLLSALAWTGFQVLKARVFTAAEDKRLSPFIAGFSALVALQLAFGVLVAGLDAGFIYNTWPLMGATFVPGEALALEPAWRNFIDNPAAVQFAHRTLGYIVLVLSPAPLILAKRWRLSACVRQLSGILHGLVVLQVVLGIATLVLSVPVALGVLHQGLGVALFLLTLYFLLALRGKTDAGQA